MSQGPEHCGKSSYAESAQFELHFENVSPETNKLYVVISVRVFTADEVARMFGEAAETREAVETPVALREAVETPGQTPIPSGSLVRTQGEADRMSGEAVEKKETSVSLLTGTYTEVSHLVKVLEQTLENAGHKDIVFSYVRAQSCIQVTVVGGKTLRLKKDSPSPILGISEIAAGKA